MVLSRLSAAAKASDRESGATSRNAGNSEGPSRATITGAASVAKTSARIVAIKASCPLSMSIC